MSKLTERQRKFLEELSSESYDKEGGYYTESEVFDEELLTARSLHKRGLIDFDEEGMMAQIVTAECPCCKGAGVLELWRKGRKEIEDV